MSPNYFARFIALVAAFFVVGSSRAQAALLPDLIITSIQMSPSNPQPGDQVVLSATIYNQGLGASPNGVINGVAFYVDGQYSNWSTRNTQSIAPGQSVTVAADGNPYGFNYFVASSGPHVISAVVDDVNRIAESNESNNSFAETVTFGQILPDLVVTSIQMSPSNPQPGDHVVFSAVVKNQGSGATPNGTTVGVLFSVDGLPVSWSASHNQSVAAGASVVLSADGGPQGSNFYIAASGSHTVSANVDDVNRIAESNEANNVFAQIVSIGPVLPDLVVTSIQMSPANPAPNDRVVFSAVVKNQGSGATPSGVTNGVLFSVDGVGVSWSASNSQSIAPGASVVLTADGGPQGSNVYVASAGNHTVVANVDDVNRIAESNESNNTLSQAFSIASSASGLPAAIAGLNYVQTFDDEFVSMSDISSGATYNGANWYNGNEQCCMADSTGLPAVMYPSMVNGQSVNPYSLIAGGGLNITLQKTNNAWYSGILTSVDSAGKGFSQQYGYFEVTAQLSGDVGTWPSFWMLSESNITTRQNIGEIDVFEAFGNWTTGFCTTFHDWSGGTTPFATCGISVPSVTDGYHKYGMLWTATMTTIYFDDQPVAQTATPAVMQQPYYMLLDMGLGGGDGNTSQTPSSSTFKVKSVKVYKAQ